MRRQFLVPAALIAVGCALGWLAAQDTRPNARSEPDRGSLPIDLKPTGGTVGPTVKDST
jgi:hypothetical protein